MPTCMLRDTEYYYELHGQGQPLILIAGYASDHQFCLPTVEALKEHFQILVFDNRGIGKTRDAGNAFSIEEMADDVMALAKHLNLKKPHILGSSMGGTIAQTIGAKYAEHIGKLVLVATTAKWRQATKNICQTQLSMRRANIDQHLLFKNMIDFMFGEEMLNNQEAIELLRDLINNNPAPQPIDDQERQLRALMAFDGRNNLSKITSQTLIINGLQDMIAMHHETTFMAEHIANSQVATFDCGHVISAEKFPEYINVVKQFLQ